MPEVLGRREPASEDTRAPLIELAGVEKMYRTGTIDLPAPDGGHRHGPRRRIDRMSEEQLAVWRGRHVGVVFQFFQLLPTLTALENAMLPLDFARHGAKRERALHNLELVGLADMADRLPSEMSGGRQQRVAIARALASYPTLVIGDEPTGDLDTKTAGEMFDLLHRVCRWSAGSPERPPGTSWRAA